MSQHSISLGVYIYFEPTPATVQLTSSSYWKLPKKTSDVHVPFQTCRAADRRRDPVRTSCE